MINVGIDRYNEFSRFLQEHIIRLHCSYQLEIYLISFKIYPNQLTIEFSISDHLEYDNSFRRTESLI